ncbi:hypothetical protein GW17_00022206 [Ensete ventricosum]|nr:hypothetical protein GW17_00022206 [Ensete ventricosum]
MGRLVNAHASHRGHVMRTNHIIADLASEVVHKCGPYVAPPLLYCRNGLLPFSYFGLLFYPSSLLVSPPRARDRRNSGSESGQSEPCSSSSGVMTRIDIKAFLALEVMKSCYGFDSTLTVESLVMIQKRYSIPDEYGLHASFLGQRTYDAYPGGFSISIDALDVRLRFPLHPVAGESLSQWRIPPSQIVPNF